MIEKITLQDLVDLLSEKNDMTKKNADALFRAMFDLIEEALANDKYVKVKGLGTFKLTEVESRESMNVNTGERIEIQGHTKISFTPDTSMKELINKPFSHFETVVLNDGVELEDTPVDEEHKMEEMAVEMPEKVIDQPLIEMEPTAEVQAKIAEEPILVEEIKVEESEDSKPIVEEKTLIEEEAKVETIQEEIPMEASKPIEKVEEKPEIIIPKVSHTENKSIFKVLIGIIIVLLVIILFGLYWIFLRQGNVSSVPESSDLVKEETVVILQEEQQEIKKDTLLVAKDTLAIQPEAADQTVVLSEDIVYEITGTITTLTLEPGQTLVKLALKYYGSKNFWPYIVEHNSDVIKDADLVPKGATIKIPKLEPKK